MAITFNPILRPSLAPCDMASTRLEWVFFTSNDTSPFVSETSVSGQTILEITNAPGAAVGFP